MRKVDKKAVAFFNWIPFAYDSSTPSAAFERDVFNYYQLLGECGSYIWSESALTKHLANLGFSVANIRCDFYDSLREMRLFYAHHPDTPYYLHLRTMCDLLRIDDNDYEQLCDLADENKFSILQFSQEDAVWEVARNELFKKMTDILKSYADALEKIHNVTEFRIKYKKALSSCYRNMKNKDYLQHLLLVWIEDAIEGGFFTPQYELRARTMVYNGDYALKVDYMLQQRFIENALNSTEIEDYTPDSVFKEILYTEYNSILFLAL